MTRTASRMDPTTRLIRRYWDSCVLSKSNAYGERTVTTPEGKVKALVKQRMADDFPSAYRFAPVLNGMGSPGLDVYYCVDSLFVAVETKAPGKKPTARQEITMTAIRAAGGLVYVVDGVVSCEQMIGDIKETLEWMP